MSIYPRFNCETVVSHEIGVTDPVKNEIDSIGSNKDKELNLY